MNLLSTPTAQRCHIAFFGMRNAGKSSLINAIANQEVSLVSDIKGTTTDPVKKTMEILPLGPVVLIDTAGTDDEGELGEKRVEKTYEILNKTDVAILVCDAVIGLSENDFKIIEKFKEKNIPYLIVYNKSDLAKNISKPKENEIFLSAKENINITEFKQILGNLAKASQKEKYIITDKIKKDDIVVLVIPIDESAPKGRLILPQQNTLRELLDNHNRIICTQETELKTTLEMLNKKPKIVITDSQVFGKIKDIVPKDILLTSFSILFARYKGLLDKLIMGAETFKKLKEGDKILISEGCTHHRQCNDIGSVKFPKWLKNFTGKNFEYDFSSGGSFPKDLTKYSLVIHCGGCMLNEKEMISRIERSISQNIPITNYGIAIAYMNNILERSVEVFPEALKILKGE